MRTKRKKYTAKEKARIAIEAIKGHLTIAEIVSKYSVHATQISKWKKEVLTQLPDLFLNKSSAQLSTEQDKELSELYEQIGRLKVENEFLKKKCDLFS